MRKNPMAHRTSIIVFALPISLLASCSSGSKSTGPAASADSAAPIASQSAAPSASGAVALAAPATIPVLKGEKFGPGNILPTALFPLEGTLVVLAGEKRVGRVAGDHFEWIEKEIPPGNVAFGDHYIVSVNGKWPDEIGVIFANMNGRAPEPTYFPLTGKGMEHVTGPGGMWGMITGVARIEDSTILAASDMDSGTALFTVRGKITRSQTKAPDGGCKEGEVRPNVIKADDPGVAIEPSAIESTPAGSLVTVGKLCEKRGPAAEIWDPKGKSHIVDLSKWWKSMSYWPHLYKGAGDELFIVDTEWQPILRVKDGQVDAVPAFERPIFNVTTSASGKLHVSDGSTIFRLDGDAWTPVARLEEPDHFKVFAMQGDDFWAFDAGLIQFKEASREVPDATCKGSFVYLFAEASTDPPNYEYPHTREKLAAFPDLDDLSLVEFSFAGAKHVGATVKTEAEGRALVAYAKEHMTDDDPRYLCFAPKVLRTFELKKPAKKP
jgi:hypothetical protein